MAGVAADWLSKKVLSMEVSMNLQQVAAGLLLFAVLGWLWRGRGVRELALHHAQARCRAEGLQLLDAHVAFAGWRWMAADGQRKRLVRRYSFEFSASGVDRRSGWLAMSGRQLFWLELPPYPVMQPVHTETPGAIRQTPGGD